jgi:hypothetical protein
MREPLNALQAREVLDDLGVLLRALSGQVREPEEGLPERLVHAIERVPQGSRYKVRPISTQTGVVEQFFLVMRLVNRGVGVVHTYLACRCPSAT